MFSCLFFFKQKTAYEMRISDWSSDVCSSDLRVPLLELGLYGARDTYWTWRVRVCQQHELWLMPDDEPDGNEPDEEREMIRLGSHVEFCVMPMVRNLAAVEQRGFRLDQEWVDQELAEVDGRSEEHTSELQSLMRISYAVFCLNKK